MCIVSLLSMTEYFLILSPDARVMDYTPRLFELSSTTGEFVASEVLYTARGMETEAAPVLQSDLYAATQPGIQPSGVALLHMIYTVL